MTILANLSDLVIEQVSVTDDVMVTARAASPMAFCPWCGMISQRVHSHYLRTLRDLPASGRPVHKEHVWPCQALSPPSTCPSCSLNKRKEQLFVKRKG